MTIFPEAAIGTAIAATITGLVSLLGLIISKENKTSDFRQQWIDALRAELSQYICHAMAINSHRAWGRETNDEDWKVVQEDYKKANEAVTKIRLRLNPTESASTDVLSLLKEYEHLFKEGNIPKTEEIDPLHHKFVIASQKLLKSEWERVKNGELVFQIARGVSFSMLISGLFVLIYWAGNSL